MKQASVERVGGGGGTDREERFRLAVESVRDYAIFLLSRQGVIETWSAGAQRIKGYAPAEIIGSSIRRFYTPEDVAAELPERLLAQAAGDGRVESEGWRVRKDGSRFWADVIITAVRDGRGNLQGFTKVTRDLTERKEQEERLRASEERFRLLVDGVRDYAIYMLDRGGRITTWNEGARRIHGYGGAEVLGHHLSFVYPEGEAERERAASALAAAERAGVFEEEDWRGRKDGTPFWASVLITALRDSAGALVGFAKITRDLTERRKLDEERLRRAQAEEALRLRDQFLSVASHELRTPLTVLQLQLEGTLSLLPKETDARLRGRLERAHRSGERLGELVESLLDVTRISTGRLEIARARLDLAELVRDVVERYVPVAAGAGCELESSICEAIDGAWDRLRMEQVVVNLLSNAAKFGAGVPISVALRREDDMAVLEVCDRGPGIPEEDLRRIFERFERASSTRHFGGLGLGLYVTAQIVELHGGTIDAGNRPGGGARFVVRLPIGLASDAGDASEA